MTESGTLPEPGTRKAELLGAVVDLFRERDTIDLSLRDVAAGIGTSHRMLQYHLGTREDLFGLAMLELSRRYIAEFDGKRPTSRADAIRATWTRFREPENRLQTQLLFALSAAAAAHPELDFPALRYDLDVFAAGLERFGLAEGLSADAARRESRLIVATLLGLYLDFYITGGSDRVDESYEALVAWVERSSADAR